MCEQDYRSTLERGDEIEADFYRLKAQEWACEPDTARQRIEAALSRPAPAAEVTGAAHINPNDVGKIATTLGFFASCIKSGEAWTEHCEDALRQALDALTKITSRPLPAPPPAEEGPG